LSKREKIIFCRVYNTPLVAGLLLSEDKNSIRFYVSIFLNNLFFWKKINFFIWSTFVLVQFIL